MRLNEISYNDAVPIDGYGPGFFRVSGARVDGPMIMAGGGVKGGMRYGATDEYGYAAIQDKVHIHDWHATMLHLLGLDFEKLSFYHNGIDQRLTDVHGKVIRPVLA